MVKRVVIGRSGEEKIVDLVKALDSRAAAGNTRPSGNKVLDYGEDFYWTRPDGITQSMREVDEGLELARDRIADAEAELEGAVLEAEQAKQLAEQTQIDLDRVETEVIPGAVADLEAADQAAQDQLAELDNRLGDFATDESLGPIREALADAQDAVDAAKSIAETANQAANAASQAALEAAGIAASKGRVIIQETEPVGEDRNAANIWIKPIPDDPTTEIEEKAITYVYLEGSNEWVPTSSDELAQAAQNALDAREAAQQATQRAETAISNAATAQSAAQAAQRTADQATLDARDAHNEAVAAQKAADNALAAATNLIPNGDFEVDGVGAVFQRWSGDAQWEIVKDPADAHQGYSFLRLTHDGVTAPWAYTVAEPSVISGRTYRFSIAMRITNGSATGSNGGMAPLWADADGGSINRSAEYPTNLWRGSRMLSELTDEWQVFTGEVVAPSDAVKIRPRLYFNDDAFTPGTVVDIDAISLLDVTDALAAEQAAADAQARADEAYAEAASKLDESQVDAKITASANGKNSITRKTVAPTTSAADRGVVAGDAWYRVDGNGDAMGMWIWSGSAWVASKVRNEMIDTIDVNKLKVHNSLEVIGDAVIDKLWADGIAAKSITANRVVVSSGNIVENADFSVSTGLGSYWSPSPGMNGGHSVLVQSSTAQRGTYDTITGADSRTRVVAGRSYKYGVWVRTSETFSGSNGVALYLTFYDGGNRVAGARMVASLDSATSGEWTFMEGPYQTPEGATNVALGYFANSTYQGSARFSEPSVIPMTGAVLIEDGAITTPKLTVTEDMSASIVNSMTVNTKKLVVTEEAVLQHAKLLGTTIVEDINVTGKLIGKDGVFTGTVDFANINVTGDVLASKISGEYLYGNVVEGGEIRTTDSGAGWVSLSDTAFYDPLRRTISPGLQIIPENTTNTAIPPGIGPTARGLVVSGGVSTSDARATLKLDPNELRMSAAQPDGKLAVVSCGNQIVNLTASEGYTGGGVIRVSPTDVRVSADTGSGTARRTGGVYTAPLYASVERREGSKVVARVRVDQTGVRVSSGQGMGMDILNNGVTFTGTTTVGGFSGSIVRLQTPPTTSGSSNALIAGGSTNGIFFKVTSSRRYKRNIADWNPAAHRVLALQPRQWQHSDPSQPGNIDERWHVGFIAEEVDELGLRQLVRYEGDGKGGWVPESLNYDRFAAAQQVVLQKHEAEINELRERIALLESK